MKACVLQPMYSFDHADAEKCFATYVELLDRCDPSMDLIVMPEASHSPTVSPGEIGEEYARRYLPVIMEKAKETARRCKALLFINTRFDPGDGDRNTTIAIDPDGNEIGYYYKAHPVHSECFGDSGLNCDYSFRPAEPYILEYGGVRYAFLTCYDFYFYENFARIARFEPDIIIGCSHQRSDPHNVLDIIGRFLCYNTGAYLVRASVSLGEHSPVGGCSMIVAPSGEVMVDLKNEVGIGCAEFDPHAKYLKPMGFGNPPGKHCDYIEVGRRPWLYRPGGPFVPLPDELAPFPRVSGCAIGTEEDTLDSIARFIARDADEIALKVVPDEAGLLCSVGAKSALPKLEKVLTKFTCHAVFDLDVSECDDGALKEIARLVHDYDCEKYVYFTVREARDGDRVRAALGENARLCLSADDDMRAVPLAASRGFTRIRIPSHLVSGESVRRAHDAGLRVNALCTGDEAVSVMKAGADCVLTSLVADAVMHKPERSVVKSSFDPRVSPSPTRRK